MPSMFDCARSCSASASATTCLASCARGGRMTPLERVVPMVPGKDIHIMKRQSFGKRALIGLTATACVAAMAASMLGAAGQTGKATDWKDWGGDAARTHFSPLTQITAANVL